MTGTADPPARPARRRFVLAGLLLACAAGAFGAGRYAWRRYAAPVPPEVRLPEDDPALAEAFQSARQKVLDEPYSAQAWGHLGKFLRASGYRPEAAECFARAERLDPQEPRWPYLRGEALLLSDPDAALPALRRAAEICDRGNDNLTPRLRLAEALMARGLYDEARANLERALEEEPDHPVAHLDLGLLALARGDLRASRSHLLRCRDSPDTRKKACSALASVEQALGHERRASELDRKAKSLPPDLPRVDPYLGEFMRLAAGKPERFRMVEQLERAGRHREAVEALGEMAARDPDPKVYVGLARNLAQLGDLAGAEQALKSAIRLQPESVQAHYLLGMVYRARGEQHLRRKEVGSARADLRAAADSAGEALARRPQYGPAHLLRGLALRDLGARAPAIEALRRAVECTPDLGDAHLHLGELLAEEGKVDEARQSLERAARLARPGDERAAKALGRLRGKG